MRTGAEYREALRDGRKVWVLGAGLVEDMTTHPATCAMVEEYVAWYDRHFDPAWQDILFAPAAPGRERTAWAYVLPKTSEDLIGMGRSFAKTLFLSAGNVTHTPAYGNLIAMGVLTAAQQRNVSPQQIADATAYRELIAESGRFLTFCGGAAPIGFRMREDPAQRAALRIVRESDAGVVISGRLGMHTSPAYAEDVYVGALNGIQIGEHSASFIVPVAAPGVTTICRKIAARAATRFAAPLSSRFDELDGQMWLDEVFIPWERVFLVEASPEPIATWLLWHHLYGWLAKAEFTLGLALALSDAMGLKEHMPTIDYVVDLVAEVQTVRTCLAAAERDPAFTVGGNCHANYTHLMPGGLSMLQAHQRLSEILRIVPGSSLVVAPSDGDLADPLMAPGLEDSFGGGGYSATQRAALLQLAADHVSSALDGRESAFELHASGGVPVWRGRLRQNFPSYNDLANAVLSAIELPMPPIDVGLIAATPLAPRRTNVSPVPAPKSGG
ncbi:MAG TPA: 4-hydroxyphenylacetate 3-hydroxylase N-terminal domain-containing protein [Stellaceae bacterium]|nr:4-hydroxyphenylacetate 3-hydroxylase N-terminal domain-containing protein [Stellaceae bacterium]